MNLNSEEYYKTYDHEAVRRLSVQTVICPATYERKPTVEACVGSTNKYKLSAKVYIHDDGSTQYDAAWLGQFGDRVFTHPHGCGGRKGVKNLRSNIVKSLLGNFRPEVFQPWLKEDFGDSGPTYLYMVDSDGYHDPFFFYRIHEIMELYPKWGTICLYNAQFHSPKNGRKEASYIDDKTVLRGMNPGISMFFRIQDFKDNPTKVQVPDGRGWDGYYSQTISRRRVITSLVSFVEHIGFGGFHNISSWERDRALNPTNHLVEVRKNVIEKVEAWRRENNGKLV